ncbi:hypothetical protein GN244_ATG20760 [Phytophthora infestans]|uniref:Uncharacterized protein n=1 Tax=Phytophthora infestans TaxID=4787 RepID=A0A833WC00_PHYIN|nr:hypothetical protein GN244_ATG20760 [Phytophthora infestans]
MRVLVRTKDCKNTLDEARNTLVITPEYVARLEADMKVRGAELHAVKDSNTANRPVRSGSRGTHLSEFGSSSSSSSLTGLAVTTAPVHHPLLPAIRMVTVKLQPVSLQSSCSELIMVQILLRYIAFHGSRYEVLDLLQFGTPDAVVWHSSSGSFFHRPPSTIAPSTRKVEPLGGYSLVLTTQPLTRKPSGQGRCVGNGVLPVERALQEAQLFTRELFRVADQHYDRDLLWSRLLFDDSRGPGADVARALALPADLFRVDVGPQQLEECLKLSICTPLELSICTPLEVLDPRLDE